MGRYIGVRLIQASIVLAIVTVLVFVIAQLLPGDAIMAAMAGSVDMHDPAVVQRVRDDLGLDRPIFVQFILWLGRFLRGDWGTSIGTGQNVLDMFLRRLPITLELFLGATLWSFAIGIPVGLVAALKRNSGLDMALTAGAIIGISIPAYWEAIVLISPGRDGAAVSALGLCALCREPLAQHQGDGAAELRPRHACSGTACALHPFEPAGGHGAGFHPDGARQRPQRTRGHRPPCRQAGTHSGGHRHRLVLGRHVGRGVSPFPALGA